MLCLTVAVAAVSGLIKGLNVKPEKTAKIHMVKVGHLVALDMAPYFVAKEAGGARIKTSMLPSSFFVDVFRNNEDLANGYIAFSINPLASMKKSIS